MGTIGFMVQGGQILRFIICVAICFVVSGAGALFTSQESLGGWYGQLAKPGFTPPGWVFGPVWTVLYFMMGVALFIIWSKGLGQPKVRVAVLIFFIQLILNAVWTPIFFGMHLTGWAFLDIILLWLAIAWTIFVFWRVSAAGGALLVPYFLWVSFAAVLNGSIWYLNR